MILFLQSNWELIAAFLTAIWAITTYFLTQRRELTWKRTEFIVQQSIYLDNDPEMRECTLILYGKHPKHTVDSFLKVINSNTINEEGAIELITKFEKYLNFLWRIAFANIVLRTLTTKDLLAFGAYFLAIKKHADLMNYCLNEGYDEIVKVAKKIEGFD